LLPVFSLSGEHDGFPAYEIYINPEQVVTNVLQWSPDINDGVLELLFGPDTPITPIVDGTINQ